MTSQQRVRFSEAPWFLNTPGELDCIIGGAGGIGSWLSLLLARVGIYIYIYDFDNLETHNLGGQLLGKHYIGRTKMDALRNVIDNFSDSPYFEGFESHFNEESMSSVIMFSAFDNMAARKLMFSKWKKHCEELFTHGNSNEIKQANSGIFIDGRLSAEQMQIFCVRFTDKKSIEEYESIHLFDDSEVEDLSCTFKQTSHAAAMIASHMVGFFTNHLTNIKAGEEDREVPFMWEYFIPLNLVTSK